MPEFFGIVWGVVKLTTAEKIAEAEKNHSGSALVDEILIIEGLDDTERWKRDAKFRKRWYHRFLELGKKYCVDFKITHDG